ncbi:hypothetical protein BDV98DRAFT_605529, partial [Pterulicium gracile]
MAPVDLIPPEILIKIFHRCLNEYAEFHRTTEAPWVTAHVCQTWSNVCRSSSRLWETFRFTARTKPSVSDLRSLLEQRIEYAGTAPLRIDVHGKWIGIEAMNVFMETLFNVHSSWGSLKTNLGQDIDEEGLIMAHVVEERRPWMRSSRWHPMVFTHLQELSLTCDLLYPETFRAFLTFFHHTRTPALYILSLAHCTRALNAVNLLYLSWAQLRHVKMETPMADITDTSTLLSRLHAVQTLSLGRVFAYRQSPPPIPSISRPNGASPSLPRQFSTAMYNR